MEVLSILESSKPAFAVAALILGAFAAPFYHTALITGHRPPYSTYIGWLLLGATGFWFHYQAILPTDPKWSAFLPAVFIIVPLSYLILLIFLKAGWHLDRRDKLCLSGVGLSWIIWVVAELTISEKGWFILVPMAALVITDTFASWPILQDSFKGKESHWLNKWSWALTFASTACGMLSVEKPWSLEIIYPSYLFLMMGMVAFCSLFSARWLMKPNVLSRTLSSIPYVKRIKP